MTGSQPNGLRACRRIYSIRSKLSRFRTACFADHDEIERIPRFSVAHEASARAIFR